MDDHNCRNAHRGYHCHYELGYVWDTYEYFIFDGREKSQRKKLLNKIINAEINVIL